ncbi:hypothetical protein C8R44DRAFT_883745 [Mycena epipterygia]|nr:hypothetical protein C8R44DRAFT_883745 [Mycena epipterygia]
MSAPSLHSFDNTLGALLIGTLVSYALFGVTTTQAYIYYGRFPNDSRKLKAMVAAVWCGELGHLICIGHSLYVMVITDYGHPERLAHLPASLFVATSLGGLVSSSVQSFFAYRIYALSNSLWIPCICWALSVFRVVPSSISAFNWLFVTVWTVSVVNDVLIAGTLVFLLYRERGHARKRTTAVVDKLIAWTIETGVVTSIAGIIMLGFFAWMRSNFIWMAWFLVITRLFSNSLLASLNSRAALREATFSNTVSGSETFGPPMNIPPPVQMSKVTMTTYDD